MAMTKRMKPSKASWMTIKYTKRRHDALGGFDTRIGCARFNMSCVSTQVRWVSVSTPNLAGR